MDELKKQLEEMKKALADFIAKHPDNTTEIDNRIKELEAKQKLFTEEIEKQKIISVPGSEKKYFSLSKVFSAVTSGSWKDAGVEAEIIREANKQAISKTITTDPESGAGAFIPVQVLAGYIDRLRTQSFLSKVGAQILPGLEAQIVEKPKVISGSTVYPAPESSDITSESTFSFDKNRMEAKMFTCFVGFTRQSLDFSNPALDPIIENDMYKSLDIDMTSQILFGDGIGGNLLGLINRTPFTGNSGESNFSALGPNGDYFSFEKAQDMLRVMEANDVPLEMGKPSFVMHPNLKYYLKGKGQNVQYYTGQTANMGMLVAPMTQQAFFDFMGAPVQTYSRMPINQTYGTGTALTPVVLCDFSQMIIGQWRAMRVERTTTAVVGTKNAFTQNLEWVKITVYGNYMLDHEEAIVVRTAVNNK